MSGSPSTNNVVIDPPYDEAWETVDEEDSLVEEMVRQEKAERAEKEKRRLAELEAMPQAEPTAEETARIQARPRRVPKLRLVVHPPPQPSPPQPANSSHSPEELESQSVAEPLQDKGKGKEVVERQGQEEREQMEAAARTLEQRLHAQTQKATRYEQRLIFERRVNAAILQERAQEHERREKKLTDQLQQLRAEQLAARSTRTSTKGRLDQFVKLRQIRKDQKVGKRGLRQNLASEKAVASATAKSQEECRHKGQAIDSLEKKLEASRAETERHEKASQTAEALLQARQNEVKELRRRNGLLEREKEALSMKCQRLEKETEGLKEVAREARRRADKAREDADEMAQAKEEAETKASSLRSENRTLKKDKKEFVAEAGPSNATLTATSTDLQGARDRLAELQTAMTRKDEKIRELETLVDERPEAWEEAREEAREEDVGGREKIPWWKVFLIQLILWIFFGLEKWEENAGGSEMWKLFWSDLLLWVSLTLVVLGVFMISADQRRWHGRMSEDALSQDMVGGFPG